jgi:hypothetical protein
MQRVVRKEDGAHSVFYRMAVDTGKPGWVLEIGITYVSGAR